MNIDLDEKLQARLLFGCVAAGDLPAVQQLLAKGCVLDEPDTPGGILTAALTQAIPVSRYASESDYAAKIQIVEALLNAGATLPENADDRARSVRAGLRIGNMRVFEQALERGCLEKTFDQLFLDATDLHHEALALRLLELGANPLYTEENRHGGKRTGFVTAARWCSPQLMSAMLDRFTIDQKNEMLLKCVKTGDAQAVSALLLSGADAAQRGERGRTLIQMASTEQVKRVLRAFKAGQSIEAAMTEDEPAAAPSSKSSFTL